MSKRQAVLITGGAKRVGAAMALYFAQQGYDIALHYNHSHADAKKLKKKIEDLDKKCALFSHDLNDVKTIPALMAQVKKVMPHCVALINNASVFERATLMKTDEALFDRQFSVNLKAPFFLTQAFAKTFKKGSAINIADADISKTPGHHFAYLLSKKSLAELTKMAARELGPNIRVNAICPGIMLPSNELDKKYMKRLAPTLPLGRLAAVEDVAKTAFWLQQNETMTGQLIFVDGGQHVL